MAVNLSPIWGAGAQLFDNSGNVLSGGKIYTYAAGTTTPATTYTSSSGMTANSNPIILNSAGRVPYEIWLTDSVVYKFVLKDSNETLIGTWDNLMGINSNFINYYGQQEIQTATANQSVFNLTEVEYEPNTGNLSVFVDGVNQYGPSAQYAYVETDATTVTFVSGLHLGASVKFTTAKIENVNVADASQITYTYPASNAVTQTVKTRLAQTVSVKDFGAVGDGVTNDTAAFAAAFAASSSVYVPIGTYIATVVIPSNCFIYGENKELSIIKAPAGANSTVIAGTNAYTLFGSSTYSTSAGSNNVSISNLTIDGNRANVTSSGDGIAIWGWGTTIQNVNVQNVRTFGIRTEWTDGSIPMEGTFNDILIQNVGEHGWYFCGPHDSYFSNVIIVDASQNADNTYYGMYIGSNGSSPSSANGRFYNLHVWHTSAATKRCAYAVYSNQGSNQFFGCHFEGCRSQFRLKQQDILSGCFIYAPYGSSGSAMGILAGNDNIIADCLFKCAETDDIYALFYENAVSGNLIDSCKFLGFKLRTPFNFGTSGAYNVVSNSYGFASSGGATSFGGTVSSTSAVEYVQDGTNINYRKPRFYIYADDDAAAAALGVPIGGFYVKNATKALTARSV